MVKHMDTNKQVQAETKKCGEPQKTGVTTTSKKSLQPFTEVLQLTVLAKVARQSSLPRTLARRPWSQVDESRVLERVRALQPGQAAMLRGGGGQGGVLQGDRLPPALGAEGGQDDLPRPAPLDGGELGGGQLDDTGSLLGGGRG